MLTDHNLASEGDEMQEDWPYSSATPLVSSGADDGKTLTGRGGLDGKPDTEQDRQAPRSSEAVGWSLPQQQHTTDIDGATPRQRLSSTYSLLSPSAPCVQDSQQSLDHPVVTPTELAQVKDLLVLLAGVAMTTPVVV